MHKFYSPILFEILTPTFTALAMTLLQRFATFIKEEKLEEFVRVELKILLSYNIPLLEKFKHLSELEMIEASRKSLTNFLSTIIDGTAIEVVKQRLYDWKQNRLPGVDKNDIAFADIILIYSAQKISLINFIPHFSSEAVSAVNITLELESYYKQVQEMAIVMFNEIQTDNQQQLLESEEKYKDLFDNATDLIHISNPAGEILYVNKSWLKTLGLSIEDLTGKTILNFIAEKEKDTYSNHRAKVLSGINEEKEIATTYISKFGKEIPVEGHISCRFKNGKAEYTRGIFRNVSKRKENENKLKFYNEELIEREENLNQLIKNAPDAIIVIDSNNTILLWNPKAEATFGWKTEEVTGKDLTETIIPEELKEGHRRGVARVLVTGQTRLINRTTEITAITKTQERLFIALTLSRSTQRGKDIFISFIRDITKQKKNELELENKRLQLEQSNQQLEQYAWLASHDLKEPLRKIVTYSDLLMTRHNEELSDDIKIQLKKIYDSTKRMDKLIQAVLQYSQINETDELFETTDLQEVLNEVLIDLELLIENKKGKIFLGELPTIKAIKIQIRQLFQNLIINAFKYSKPSVPPVIKVTSITKNGSCKICIEDNGIGFNNDYVDKIFMIFQRLQTEKREEGTGIGLAICKRIAERHNGSIKAKSIEGQGSVFEVTLPINQ